MARPGLPWVLFAVSLALNLLFAAGALYAWLGGADSAPQVDPVAALELTESQTRDLAALRAELAEMREDMRASREEVRALLIPELVEPDFDRAKVEALLRQRGEQRIPYFADIAQRLHGWLQTLRPEQRARFEESARDRGFLRALLTQGER